MANKLKLGKLFFAFIIATVLLSISAVAIVSYADFQDGTTSKTISKGQGAVFDVALFSVSPPLDYTIRMKDPNDNYVKTWFDNAHSTDGFVEQLGLAVNPSDITIGGDYIIEVTGLDARGDSTFYYLTLTVLNIAPEITGIDCPDSITAGNSLNVKVYAFDADNDILSYKIYRNNVLISNTDHDEWQTSASDVGTYVYKFEVSDGEETVSQEKTVVVNKAGTKKDEIIDTLRLSRDLEVSSIYGFLKLRNTKGEKLDDLEFKITYMGTDEVDKFTMDLGKNDVEYRQLSSKLDSNQTYLAKIEVIMDNEKDSGFILIKK